MGREDEVENHEEPGQRVHISVSALDDCPCGRGQVFVDCCGPVIDRSRLASTAEDLMRSRFSAFVIGDADYLRFSWAPSECPDEVRIDPARQWTALEILATERGRALDADGIVEFVAHYDDRGRPCSLRERSRFVRHEGRWVYLDGEHG